QRAEVVEDAATVAADIAAYAADVVADGAVGQRQRAAVEDAATVAAVGSVAEGQPTDHRGDTAVNREDTEAAGAAESEELRPRAANGDVATELRQLPAQGDGGVGDVELNGVGPRVEVRQLDGFAQGQVTGGVDAVVHVVADVHHQSQALGLVRAD